MQKTAKFSWLLSIIGARRTLLWLAFVIRLIGTGCESVRDISNDKRYATDYAIGDVYRIRTPVFLWSGDLTRWQIKGGECFSVEPGLKIQIAKLELFYGGPEMGSPMQVKANFLDGPFTNQLVEIYSISRMQVQRHPSAAVYFVDTNILERVLVILG
jgi:hypothetical protein